MVQRKFKISKRKCCPGNFVFPGYARLAAKVMSDWLRRLCRTGCAGYVGLAAQVMSRFIVIIEPPKLGLGLEIWNLGFGIKLGLGVAIYHYTKLLIL